MYTCDICGRETNKKYKLYGYTLCGKHFSQLVNHGEFLDNNPRTLLDLNEYRIEGNDVYIDLYNVKSEKINEFVISIEDFEKIRYKRWGLSNGYVVSRTKMGKQRFLTHVIMDVPPDEDSKTVVDHIDGDKLNNRRSNLRICAQTENAMNHHATRTNKSGYVGVRQQDNGRYYAFIKFDKCPYNLGTYNTIEEAAFARYVAEQILCPDYAHKEQNQEKKKAGAVLSENIKLYIIDHVAKVIAKKA